MIVLNFRRLTHDESGLAAQIHRRAGALIPGYDTSIHSEEDFAEFYRSKVMPDGPVWGAFDDGRLTGHVALKPGWLDHLYVDPDFHGRGVGSALVKLAQREQTELRLYTFQSNVRAQALYERHGFTVEERTNGERNEEKMPDMTYHWRKPR